MRTYVHRSIVGLAALLAACGSPSAPTVTAAAITVSANPSSITGSLCTGCGAGSTDREAASVLSIQETAGVGGVVALVDMTLREVGTNAVMASGSFDATAVTQLAGTNRVAARGSLSVRCGVHYPAGQAGRSAVLTYAVRVTDDRGNQVTQSITVNVVT